jgi:hypothetical protein
VPIKTDNMIFVFGSNLAGYHGAGAAKYAMIHKGAQLGIGVGRTGQCYAIPTKGVYKGSIGQTLPLRTIQGYVDEFLAYARCNPTMTFQVTCIGCGLAGLRHEQIAPMFIGAPMNCWFDEKWKQWLTKSGHRFWGAG